MIKCVSKSKVALLSLCAGALVFMSCSDKVYGLMDISYDDFYKGEMEGCKNVYEVDSVSSATTTKWSKNGAGELFEGTFNEGNSDGSGSIKGVRFPVEISKKLVDKFSENYNFELLSEKPAVYKKAVASASKLSFSKINSSNIVKNKDLEFSFSTSTAWGDYVINCNNIPEGFGAIYGVVLKTSDGYKYAMRHEENIWRKEIAWSSGVVTKEPHGNELSYVNFKSLMGKTIDEIEYITLNGVTYAETSIYVPVKGDYSVSVENADAASNGTKIVLANMPSDYKVDYEFVNFEGAVENDKLTFAGTLPGKYSVKIHDINKVYADASCDFMISTNSIPVNYKNGKLCARSSVSENEVKNYLKNITAVSVNGKKYSASGRQSVRLVNEEGVFDFEAKQNDEKIFNGSKHFEIVVSSQGFTQDLKFSIDL